jgi:hypothetical protein
MHATKFYVTLLALVLLAVVAALPASRGVAQGLSATTTTLSAQAKPDDKDKGQNRGKAPAGAQPHNQQQNKKTPSNVQQKQIIQQRQNVQQQQIQQKKEHQKVEPKQIQQSGQQQKKFTGQPRKFTPKHDHVVQTFKMKGANKAFVHGQNYSVFRQDYRRRYNGNWRTFVALGALAPLLIGAYEFYPYAYLDVPADYCEGQTEDGCEMVYDEVETVEGDLVPQCVAYCPWQ